MAAALIACAALLGLCGCRRGAGTYDVSNVAVTGYRYLIDPSDEYAYVVGEIENRGSETVRALTVVASGLGRSGEKRGESRARIENLRPGERRRFALRLANRWRLVTVEVAVEPVPEEEQRP